MKKGRMGLEVMKIKVKDQPARTDFIQERKSSLSSATNARDNADI
jgi:hypothetical protein